MGSNPTASTTDLPPPIFRRAARHRKLRLGALATVVALASAACRPPVKVQPIDPVLSQRRARETAVIADRPSEHTLQTLRILDIDWVLEESPSAAVLALDSLVGREEHAAALYAASELALLEARRASAEPSLAAGWYAIAAARSYEYLFGTARSAAAQAFDPHFHEMLEAYNRAVGRLVQLLHELGGSEADVRGISSPLESFSIAWGRGWGAWEPLYFDELIPAESRRVEGLRNRHATPGLGAPLIALRENRNREALEKHYPPEGIVFPATAVLEFGRWWGTTSGGTRFCTLTLYDPRRVQWLRLAGKEVPLAADFTAPYGFLLARTELRRIGKLGLLNAERGEAHRGLFMLEPYDPEKIPVVMVHGLYSSPIAWMELTNDLGGDPTLRRSYQIWHYMYPTGLPYLLSASLFREALRELRQQLDPDQSHRATDSMVVVGHSMGGLLAKTLVTDSGTKLWDAVFRVPPSGLNGSEEEIGRLRRILTFSRRPYVKRVIFIATPHRGSRMAEGFIGRLASGLVDLPEDFQALLRRIAERNPEALTDRMRKLFRRGGANSIQALRPTHPLMQVLGELPIHSSVPCHTIVGDRGRQDAEDERSDGVVPYESAHLEDAVSELVVPSDHKAYGHPIAIAEVRRILRDHLGQDRRNTEK